MFGRNLITRAGIRSKVANPAPPVLHRDSFTMSTQGPLPVVDGGSILQEQSKRALQAALPISEYIFRDERMDDYGVDGSIELLADGMATNIRAQVQLKGRSNTQVNKSGYVAVQVATSNLNYLLNGTCPLYVLFRPEANELRFTLARNEWSRVERDNPGWRDQRWITIQFHNVLTPQSIAQLRASITAEAVLRRTVDERLNQLRTAAGHSVLIDTQNLNVTDSGQVVEVLGRIGQMLTNSGLASLVIERARQVPTSMLLGAPRAALAVAHAHYHLSRYYDASAAVRQLLLTNPVLDADDRSLLEFLHISIRRMLGEIDEAQCGRETDAWLVHAPADLVVQYDIGRTWSNYTSTMLQSTEAVRTAAKDAVRSALARGRLMNSQQMRDYVELLELTLQHNEIEDAAIDAQALNNLAMIDIGDAHSARERLRASSASMKAWLKVVENLARKTCSKGSKTHCLALLLVNHAALAQERQRRYAAWAQGQQDPGSASALSTAARETLRVARELEDRDLELTAMLALAETLDTCGDQDEATTIARETLKVAELSGSAVHVRQASQFLDGAERDSARKRMIIETAARSEEQIIRDAGDEQLFFMTKALLTAYQLPTSRAPNVLHSLQCQRQLARERRDWCKHIVLAQWKPAHETHLTMYAERPTLQVVCVKLDKEGLVRSSSAERVSEEFRTRHCGGCAHREPDLNMRESQSKTGNSLQSRADRNKAKAARRRRKL
jgi:Domain of unknown function (DUF4365)